VVLAGFAALGCGLSIYLIVAVYTLEMHTATMYQFFQWIPALYAILDFAIALGYLKGFSWGPVVGYFGAFADILPLVILLSSATGNPVASNSSLWLALLLLGVMIYTFVYLQKKNVKEWFRVE
jgi:hypothetical protein